MPKLLVCVWGMDSGGLPREELEALRYTAPVPVSDEERKASDNDGDEKANGDDDDDEQD
jgi:hypothetical protein